ncbi:MAG: radical SAM protein [Phycisphaerae bacterium]|nr:radical SAM protein [Phycisphaerae bacterium]
MPEGPPTIDPLGLGFDEFVASARREHGLTIPAATEAYKRFFREGATDLPGVVRPLVSPVTRRVTEEGDDGVITKFVTAVPSAPPVPGRCLGAPALAQLDTLAVESVLIPMVGKKGRRTFTLCVSSQVGCAMACGFCETGRMGLVRSLTPGEIVSQWWTATHTLAHPVSNIVFMGMGEPMDNLDNVLAAIAALTDHHGAGFPMSKIVVSTVGRLDGIRRLAEVVRTRPGWKRLNLALSLNAPNDCVRSELMPVNRRWGMGDLRGELLAWPRFGGAKLCFEYVLIPGVNDAPGHAAEVAAFVEPFRTPDGRRTAMVNVIPYNPRRDSPWPAPGEEQVERFVEAVAAHGTFVTRRRTKGRTLMGACGQLGDERIRRRRLVEQGA